MTLFAVPRASGLSVTERSRENDLDARHAPLIGPIDTGADLLVSRVLSR